MSEGLSPNTKAILLLTAPLIAGRVTGSPDLLTPGEYKKLALHLREAGNGPCDLLKPDADSLIAQCRRVIDTARLERLLARGFLLGQAVERWQARAIWVLSGDDQGYPQRLKTRLKEDAPSLLYGCGQRDFLDGGGLAVVGSRNADESLILFAEEVGRRAASAARTLVSGGARGIDQAAMRGALGSGGRVIGLLADSLERTALARDNRNPLLDGQLVLLSPYDPNAGFNVGHAMQRNKLIYALSDAALVVNADVDRGGTWAGAAEQLEKLRLVPVYVRSSGGLSDGLAALRERGALLWPDPEDNAALNAALSIETPGGPQAATQARLPFAVG